jgi:hypothetical protein
MEKTFDEFANSFKSAVKMLNFSAMYGIDRIFYLQYVRHSESESNWNLWQRTTAPYRNFLTSEFEKRKPFKSVRPLSTTVFFIFTQHTGLAHETYLANQLLALDSKGYFFDICIVYISGSKSRSETCHQIFSTPKINFFFLEADDFHIGVVKLQKLIDQQKPRTLVYVADYFQAFYFSLLIDHTSQKFLITKYIPLQEGRIIEYAVGRRSQQTHFVYKGLSYSQLDRLSFPCPIKTANPKKPLGFFIFGSISRVEKIRDPIYVDFVIKMLSNRKNLIYVFTSQATDIVPPKFLGHERCKNIGWVDPMKWIKIFDIYLDPFPFGGGEMSCLAISNLIPYLSCSPHETGVQSNFAFMSKNCGDSEAEGLCSDIAVLERKFNELMDSEECRDRNVGYWQSVLRRYRPDFEAWGRFFLD